MILSFEEESIYVDDRLINFAILMQKELENNSHKGDIFDWNPFLKNGFMNLNIINLN